MFKKGTFRMSPFFAVSDKEIIVQNGTYKILQVNPKNPGGSYRAQ
ncbi:hypothetical protein [Pontibacter harenae]|nr:hypothetical protein [Pontibacter harenae]